MRAVPGQRPRPLGDPRVHLMRVRRMAKAVGADPAAAQNAGLLEHDDWVAMVERCRTCEIPAACDRWLDGRNKTKDVRQGCLNARVLAKLREGKAP